MSSNRRVIVKRIVASVVAVCAVFVFVDGFTRENWITVGLSVAAAVLLIDWVRPTPSSSAHSAVDPAAITVEEVRRAISDTDGRVPAIKLLRQRHAGLGLKEAKELVDAQISG